jgi:lipopolysaccharide/colanic/teichoic acid biosynthesis glycosyltransferase
MLANRAVDDSRAPGEGGLGPSGEVSYVDLTVLPPLVRFAPSTDEQSEQHGWSAVSRSWGTRIKRAFDVAAATLLLVFLAPLLALTAAAVYLGDRGPVFYRQVRVGWMGREFRMIKFRSMVVAADRMCSEVAPANMGTGLLFKIENDPRITRVGRLLRRLSVDELPQLLNVLRGDMSLVGPRPLPVSPECFDEVANQRHAVRPGITGPWQVAGNAIQRYEDMIQLDLSYIESRSFAGDLALLGRTPVALLLRGSGDR